MKNEEIYIDNTAPQEDEDESIDERDGEEDGIDSQ